MLNECNLLAELTHPAIARNGRRAIDGLRRSAESRCDSRFRRLAAGPAADIAPNSDSSVLAWRDSLICKVAADPMVLVSENDLASEPHNGERRGTAAESASSVRSTSASTLYR